jgi:hypothetical protein
MPTSWCTWHYKSFVHAYASLCVFAVDATGRSFASRPTPTLPPVPSICSLTQDRTTYADSVQLYTCRPWIFLSLDFLLGFRVTNQTAWLFLKCYEPDRILLFSVKTWEWWLMTNDKHRHHAAVAWQPRTRLPTQTARKRSSNRPPQILKLDFSRPLNQGRFCCLLQDASPSEENIKIS